jgi:DNA sulfur modification protein DndE
MKPPVEHVRITPLGRDQLIRLKRQSGIEHWNILCRWALCASLREKSCPPPIQAATDGGIEMTWKVFSGDWSSAFAAVITIRAHQDGFDKEPDGLSTCLRLHIHRGLGYLSSGKEKNPIEAFMSRWTPVL